MTALLDPSTADKLARICGMFGSDHDGARANAAKAADRLIRPNGLTWHQVLSARAVGTMGHPTIETQIDFALQHGALSPWEEGFLRGVRGRQFLTEKQLSKLAAIVAKTKAYAEARA